MNFFEHQAQARRTSVRLMALFALYVLMLVLLLNGVAAWLYGFSSPRPAMGPLSLRVTVTLTVLGVIAVGMLYKVLELREGGAAVARMVGGRAVDPTTRDLLERRLLNVVEEMALAAGVAMPRVYVLDQERAINAFAAGYSPNEAVIAVTRGALTRLSRDELQGVIGHEFSHILNGDMALNLRLLGVLHGLLILALAGRYLMELVARSRSNSSKSDGAVAGAFVLGAALWLLGYLGVLVGRLIKAGVSRQREFLADASSVQFTRNPDGIGGALRKIGNVDAGVGSRVQHPQAEALSHMWLAAGVSLLSSGWLATHPPLRERVQRIYGRSMPWLATPDQAAMLEEEAAASGATSTTRGSDVELAPIAYVPIEHNPASPLAHLVQSAPALTPERVVASVGQVAPLTTHAAPSELTELEHTLADSTRAAWVAYALLIDKEHALRAQQRQLITTALGPGVAQKLDALHGQVQALPPGARLPLLERAVPSLIKLAPAERQRILQLTQALIAADGKVTLTEFLLFTVLKRRIGPTAGRAVPVRYARLPLLATDVGLVLSLLAILRLPERPEVAFNAGLLLAPGVDCTRTDVAHISLEAVNTALERLNQLAPLAKPLFIRACAATVLVEGSTTWQAASCLRVVCAAIDAPLPPALGPN